MLNVDSHNKFVLINVRDCHVQTWRFGLIQLLPAEVAPVAVSRNQLTAILPADIARTCLHFQVSSWFKQPILGQTQEFYCVRACVVG